MIAEKTHIYGLIDPRTDEIRYVGKADDPKGRLELHLDSTQLRGNTHKNNWIKLLLREGLQPRMTVIEEVDVGRWEERERYWIKKLRERGCSLTNMTDGGDGWSSGRVHSEESLEKIRAAWRTGVPTQKSRETRARKRAEREVERQHQFEEEMVRGSIPDQVATREPLHVLAEEECVDQVLDALGELKQRELEVLRVRYGSHKCVQLREVGKLLGYSGEWVRLREKEAVAALAERLTNVDFPGEVVVKGFQCFFNLVDSRES